MKGRSLLAMVAVGFLAVWPVVSALNSPSAHAQSPALLIKDGDFEYNVSSRMLRAPEKPQGWFESRRDTNAGRKLLMLSKKPIGGNATKKAMLKANPKFNAYLSQKLASTQKGRFALQWDIYVREIVTPPNRSCFQMLGTDAVKGRGPNATGAERFVFLAFENAAAGKINLVAMEDAGAKPRVIAPDLSLKKWYTIQVEVDVPGKRYTVQVPGMTTQPVAVAAFVPKGKPTPKEITHLSFATWNDGPGTFYVDNVR